MKWYSGRSSRSSESNRISNTSSSTTPHLLGDRDTESPGSGDTWYTRPVSPGSGGRQVGGAGVRSQGDRSQKGQESGIQESGRQGGSTSFCRILRSTLEEWLRAALPRLPEVRSRGSIIGASVSPETIN